MVSTNDLASIRTTLEQAQNPLFFFDNDADGLCAFLILQRSIERGKGIPIKSYPELTEQYLRKVDELHPDLVVVLDKADITPGFILGAEERNIPILWLDHHPSMTDPSLIAKTEYVNSMPTSEPVTYIAQKVFNRQEDLWLAMIGCTADVYKPDFAQQFETKYPELYNSALSPFEALHTTEVGKFVLMLNFGLMNSTTNVVKLLKYLMKAAGPYDLLEENFYTREFHKRYNELYAEFQKLVARAKDTKDITPGVRYFSYASTTSMSALVANRLYYELPNKLLLVGYKRPEKINLSIRGHNALEFTNHMTQSIDGVTGGGHEEATGAMVPASQEESFLDLLGSYTSKNLEP